MAVGITIAGKAVFLTFARRSILDISHKWTPNVAVTIDSANRMFACKQAKGNGKKRLPSFVVMVAQI